MTNINEAFRNIQPEPPFEPLKRASFISPNEANKFFRGTQGGFFGDIRTDFVEIAAYNADDGSFRDDFTSKAYKINQEGQLLVPTYQHLNQLSLENETGYILRYNFLRKVIYPRIPENFQLAPISEQQDILRRNLGSRIGMKLFVHEISEDRTEIRVLPKLIGSKVVDVPFQETFLSFFSEDADGSSFDYVANFGQSQLLHIVNWTVDATTFPDFPNSVVLKTYEPVPDNIERNQEFWINQEVFPSYVDRVRYVETQSPTDLVYLRGPDFNATPQESDFRDTGRQTWDTLLDSNEQSSNQLLENLLDRTSDTNLNVDYTDFSNFIKFSSALERVRNFQYKLGVYQDIQDDIDSITSNAALSSTGELLSPQKRKEVQSLQDKKTTLSEAFDGFESWMFNNSDIRTSGGDLLDINDPAVQTFFEDLKTSADLYDRNNPNALSNQLPEFIRADKRNQDFELFTKLVAHYFDIIWTYIKHMQYVHDRSEDKDAVEGLSSDLSQFVANSFGYDVFNGFELEDAFQFLVGDDEKEYEQVNKQVWRRVLNNIPYLSKTKGTRRSIEALLSIYGVPKVGLSIREYGSASDASDVGFQTIQDETHSLGFYGNQSINVDLNTPITDVEMRFKTQFNTATSRLLEITDSSSNPIATLDLVPFSPSSEYGYLEISLPTTGQTFTVGSGSNRIPYFDGNFASVQISYDGSSFVVRAGKASPIPPYGSSSDISQALGWFAVSSVVPTSGFNVEWNDATSIVEVANAFHGDVDYVRAWTSTLTESTFQQHVIAPFKYDTDNTNLLSSNATLYDPSVGINGDLLFNIDFADAMVENDVSGTGFSGSITTTGYSPLEPDDFQFYLRDNHTPPVKSGSRATSNTKVRTESATLLGALSPDRKSEAGSLDTFRKDSKSIGVFFSPVSRVDQDITASIGIQDVNALLANPESLYQDSYQALNAVNKKYWMKYPSSIDFNAYFRYIDQFNRGFFKQLKNIVPSRAGLTYGALIEPHLLERHRVKTQDVIRERLDDTTIIHVSNLIQSTGNSLDMDPSSIHVSDLVSTYAEQPVYIMEGGIDVDEYSTRTFRYAGNFLKETGFQTLQSPGLYPNGTYYLNESTGQRNPDSLQRFRRVPFQQKIQFIFPLTDENQYTHNNYFQVFGFAFAYNDSDKTLYGSARYSNLDRNQLVSTPLGDIQPPEFPYKRYRHHIFNREFRTATKRIKGISTSGVSAARSQMGLGSCGALNHSGTTVDGGPAVEFIETTSERLIVSPSDRDKGQGPILDVQ